MIQAIILDQIKPVSSWQTFNKFNNSFAETLDEQYIIQPD
jgi:hypothetical protein